MTKEDIRIGVSWGLILTAIVHAVMLAALCVGVRHGAKLQMQDAPTDNLVLPRRPYRSIGDEELQKFAEPPTVNYSAQHELKQQCPGGQCPTRVPSRPTNSNPFNLAPGERLVDVGPIVTVPSQPIITPVKYPLQPAQNVGTPTPAKSYQVLLFLDSSQQAVALQNWFDQDPELLKLRAKSSFQVYTANNSLYRTRFANVVPTSQFPAVLVQDATGGHIHAAGKSMIPATPQELVSDITAGYQLYKQAKQGTMQATGAIRTAGYSWDDQINPAMRLSSDNCGPGGCPPQSDPWYPGKKVNDLFDRVDGKNPLEALFWGNPSDLATIAVYGAAALLLVFVIARRK
jgi:predicted RecA/RadA family phage recombinase